MISGLPQLNNIIKEILKEFKEKHFKEEEIRIIRPKKDGKALESVLLQEFLA